MDNWSTKTVCQILVLFQWIDICICLSDPGVPGVRSMGPDLCPRGFADLTDVTLADEDSNSIPTNDVNRAILGNLAMQVAPLGGQNWNWSKWQHWVDKLVTRSPNCWPNLQLMHVVLSGGQNWNLYKWLHQWPKLELLQVKIKRRKSQRKKFKKVGKKFKKVEKK